MKTETLAYSAEGGQTVQDIGPRNLIDIVKSEFATQDEKRLAFSGLVRNFSTMVHGTAFRKIHSFEDAQDVAQEAFIHVWKAIDGYQHGNFESWLNTITVHAAFDELRKTRRRPSEPTDDTYMLEAEMHKNSGRNVMRHNEDDYDPSTIYDQNERKAEVEKLLYELPPHYKETLELWAKKLEYQEIADLLDIPIGTVRSRIHRGLRLLIGTLGLSESEQKLVS